MEFHFSLTVRCPKVSPYGCAHILHADTNIPAQSFFVNVRTHTHTHTETHAPTLFGEQTQICVTILSKPQTLVPLCCTG